MSLITTEEIQESITENDYMAITQGDDAVTAESLDNARAYVAAVAESYGLEYDEDDSVLRLAVRKKTLAEMYAYAADWTTSEQYQKEAVRLLAPLAPAAQPQGSASYTETGRRDWYGY